MYDYLRDRPTIQQLYDAGHITEEEYLNHIYCVPVSDLPWPFCEQDNMKNSDIYKALLSGMDEETKKLLESGVYPEFKMKDWTGYRWEVDQGGKWRLVKEGD